MNLPPLFYWTKGSLWDTANVWFMQKFRLPIIDRDYKKEDFLYGALQAIDVVSKRLAARDYDGLAEMIDADALAQIRPNLDAMTDEQRSELPIEAENVFTEKIGEINIATDNTCKPPKHFVQILVLALARRPIEKNDAEADAEADDKYDTWLENIVRI